MPCQYQKICTLLDDLIQVHEYVQTHKRTSTVKEIKVETMMSSRYLL